MDDGWARSNRDLVPGHMTALTDFLRCALRYSAADSGPLHGDFLVNVHSFCEASRALVAARDRKDPDIARMSDISRELARSVGALLKISKDAGDWAPELMQAGSAAVRALRAQDRSRAVQQSEACARIAEDTSARPWNEGLLLDWCACLIPRSQRETVLGDIYEDELEDRAKGTSEWWIFLKKCWQLSIAVGQHIPKWLSWVARFVGHWLIG